MKTHKFKVENLIVCLSPFENFRQTNDTDKIQTTITSYPPEIPVVCRPLWVLLIP